MKRFNAELRKENQTAPRSKGRSISCSPAIDRLASFFVRRSPSLGLALVPELLPFCQRKFNLHSTIFEVHPGRDQRQPFLLRLADELLYLVAMHQQFTG